MTAKPNGSSSVMSLYDGIPLSPPTRTQGTDDFPQSTLPDVAVTMTTATQNPLSVIKAQMKSTIHQS